MMKSKENITLIGMPAVGKTTVGHLMAKALEFQFIDSDDLIEQGEKKNLSQIIAKDGLSKFLEIEETHILSIGCKHHVIATGGSVVYKKKAMAHLARISTIIYLCIDVNTLLTRLSNLTDRGVAIAPGKSVEDLYKERTPLYDAWCDIKIDCKSLTADEVSKKALTNLL
ncbi:MAG: shikimate kinase [Desulfobacula sp.]|nr:shikimate kinase [Desulfobacula sp.]